MWDSDLRYAMRGLLLRPGFLIAAVLTLALGLGVNAGVFTLFHHMLIQPLPVAEPGRLVNVVTPGPKSGWTTSNVAGDVESILNYPLFRDLERAQGTSIRLAGHRTASMNLAHRGATVNIDGAMVSGSYFSVLGLAPHVGRLLAEHDDAVPGQAQVVVLGHGFWQDRLGGERDIVGQTVRINGLPMTVAGIAPPGFQGTTLGLPAQVFVPISVRWPDRPDSLPQHDRRDSHWVYVFGRLAAGVPVELARAALQATYSSVLREIEAPLQDMDEATLERFLDSELLLTPGARGQSWVPEQTGTAMNALLVVAGLVLLIACVNLANLLLARGVSRGNEMAVRSAIGASAGRLRRQLLLEAGLLAALGAVLALPFAWVTLKGLVALMTTGVATVTPPALSPATVLFTVVAAALTVLVFGLYPAWSLSRQAQHQVLRAQAGQAGGERSGGRLRSGLAVAQIALSLALLSLAGLFLRSLDNLARVDLGMQVDSVLTYSMAPALNGYDPARSQVLFQRIEQSVSALPGVESVALASVSLVANNNWGSSVTVQGYEPGPGETMHTYRNDVGPGFFATLQVPVLAGREFGDGDSAQSPPVAIVNQAFVERYGLGGDVIGRRVSVTSGDPGPEIEIVGVVADSTYSQVRQAPPPVLYRPIRQNPSLGTVNVYLRSRLALEAQAPALRSAMAGIDADLPVMNLRTLSAQVHDNIALDRTAGVLSSVFAGLATLLAAVGLFGLFAHTVAQRTREMGLRLALGAEPARVRNLVLRQVARLMLIGGGVGLLLAVAGGIVAQSLLYELPGHDPLALFAATALLLSVVLAAAWWPAWRASRVDPMVALRHN